MKLLMFLLALLPVVFSFNLSRPPFTSCQKAGVRCINKTDFVYCLPYFPITLGKEFSLKCPEGYICRETQRSPCVKNPDGATSTEECTNCGDVTESDSEEVTAKSEDITA